LRCASFVRRPFDARQHERREIVEIAVEVLHRAELEAAEVIAEHVLRQADRVRHGHDDDFAAQLAGRLERGDLAAQQRGDQHAGQFVRVQRRLDVDLLAAARAVVEARDLALGADGGGNQRMGLRLHDEGRAAQPRVIRMRGRSIVRCLPRTYQTTRASRRFPLRISGLARKK